MSRLEPVLSSPSPFDALLRRAEAAEERVRALEAEVRRLEGVIEEAHSAAIQWYDFPDVEVIRLD